MAIQATWIRSLGTAPHNKVRPLGPNCMWSPSVSFRLECSRSDGMFPCALNGRLWPF